MADQQALITAARTAVRDATPGIVKDLLERLGEPADAAAVNAVVSALGYAENFGTYLLSQNPYSALTDLILPEIPSGPNEENPAGGIWDENPNTPPTILKSGVLKTHHSQNIYPETEPIPSGTVVPFGIMTSLNGVTIYHHNIVKMIRIRYRLKNRKNANGEDSTSFGLYLTSGADT